MKQIKQFFWNMRVWLFHVEMLTMLLRIYLTQQIVNEWVKLFHSNSKQLVGTPLGFLLGFGTPFSNKGPGDILMMIVMIQGF